ncbi:glutamate--tRNA ligase [Sulfurovum sp. zt1-1]|uniref:Glutamate--tRNA ligase n=1 Tax=Sulfurovum zhangzhouensis TaxID=3019067 RepID=A0ABT7QZY7_9BACT|nr:glutamate--tRNA ligase [Sulfurovum zhangzhouensis]MDM5272395.1 glutamate--tRNA ligase [Sulfurovum zhangzhouensis]
MAVTRFAPSPTGYLHIGGLRTALFSWLWARKTGGKFLLRIEDTDLARNSEDALDAIIKAFDWVGMSYDGEVLYQSKRFDIYKKYIQQLLDEGKAYKCYMSKEELDALRESQMAAGERPRYDGKYRDFTGTPPEGVNPVIRIKAPTEGTISFVDGVKGDFCVSADEVDDFIIARSDGTPTYNFVVAIDDALMGLSDVIRGDDHLYNTPKQIVVYNALGFKLPKFYHVAMINNEQGKKLSKRDGATDVMEYEKLGFLPEALLNFLVRLGWSYGDQEIFSLEEMVELFEPKNLSKSSSNYNLDKLLWLNAHYIKNTPNSRLADLLHPFGVDIREHDKNELLLDATKERGKTLVELAEQIKLILHRPEAYDEKAVKKAFKGDAKEILAEFAEMLQSWEKALHLPCDYHEVLEKIVETKEIGFGKIGQPLRISLLGSMTGSGLDEIMSIIGVEETVQRINKAIAEIE